MGGGLIVPALLKTSCQFWFLWPQNLMTIFHKHFNWYLCKRNFLIFLIKFWVVEIAGTIRNAQFWSPSGIGLIMSGILVYLDQPGLRFWFLTYHVPQISGNFPGTSWAWPNLSLPDPRSTRWGEAAGWWWWCQWSTILQGYFLLCTRCAPGYPITTGKYKH